MLIQPGKGLSGRVMRLNTYALPPPTLDRTGLPSWRMIDEGMRVTDLNEKAALPYVHIIETQQANDDRMIDTLPIRLLLKDAVKQLTPLSKRLK